MRVWVCVCVYVCLVQYTHNAYASQLCCLLKYPVLFALVVLVIVLVYLVMASTFCNFIYCFPFSRSYESCPLRIQVNLYILQVCVYRYSLALIGNIPVRSPTLPFSSLYICEIYTMISWRSYARFSLWWVCFSIAVPVTLHTHLSLSPAKGDIQVYAIYSQLCWHFNKLSSSIHSSLLNCFPISI